MMRRRRTRSEVDDMRATLSALLEADHPQSVRHLFYLMTDPRLPCAVEKSENGYRHVQYELSEMRKAGLLFEFTGKKTPKSKWKFTKTGEEWFCFAGLWRPMPKGTGDAFTLLTTAPGPDVAPIHDRQMVVLEREDWAAWLNLTQPEAALLRPLTAGALRIEQVK
jgi:hypothetical protein